MNQFCSHSCAICGCAVHIIADWVLFQSSTVDHTKGALITFALRTGHFDQGRMGTCSLLAQPAAVRNVCLAITFVQDSRETISASLYVHRPSWKPGFQGKDSVMTKSLSWEAHLYCNVLAPMSKAEEETVTMETEKKTWDEKYEIPQPWHIPEHRVQVSVF